MESVPTLGIASPRSIAAVGEEMLENEAAGIRPGMILGHESLEGMSNCGKCR
jgi:hypothetical protein